MYSELLEDNNIDALYTLGVHPIHNLFSQHHHCNVYQLWQSEGLYQPLLGLVNDLMNWLPENLKVRQVKTQFDNTFTSVSQYPSLQHFYKSFGLLKSGTWIGKNICGMIRTLAVNCAPILVSCKDDGKTEAETACDEMAMGAVRLICEFTLHVSEQNHSNLSLKPQDDAFKQFYQERNFSRTENVEVCDRQTG
jgi:hypothetical protein